MTQIRGALTRAMQALQQQDFSGAQKQAKLVLKLQPSQPDALHLLGIIAKNQQNFPLAADYFEKSLAANSKQPVVLSNYANLLVAMEKYSNAAEYYAKSVKLAPNNLDAWINWVNMLNSTEQYSQALQVANQAESKGVVHPSLLTLVGLCHRALEQFEQAIEAFDSALAIAPQDFYAGFNKAATLRLMQHPEEAVTHFQGLIRNHGEVPDVLYNLGCAFYDLEDYKESERLLKRTLELQPEHIEAHKSLNEIYWENRNENQFLQSFRHTIRSRPQSQELRYAYASNLILAERDEEARDVLKQAISDNGGNHQLWHALGVLESKLGDAEGAKSLIYKSIKQAPLSSRYRIDYANLLIKEADYATAFEHLENGHQADPLNQEIWAYKGLCWRLTGDEREHWLNNYDLFVKAQPLATPEGYDNQEHFLHCLAKELRMLHKNTKQPLDQSVRGGSQTLGNLLLKENKVLQDFKSSLQQFIQAYLDSLPDDPDHPFLSRKKQNFRIAGSWSVLLNSQGFHTNHVHPQGWLSGPTYIEVPDCVSETDPAMAGWVKFGETSLGLADREKIGKAVCPQPGMSVLFPSYTWHGTNKFVSNQSRITAPVDISPAN